MTNSPYTFTMTLPGPLGDLIVQLKSESKNVSEAMRGIYSNFLKLYIVFDELHDTLNPLLGSRPDLVRDLNDVVEFLVSIGVIE